ncbi:MAG: InlB B-repeat-containing protein [Treponema sp.]|nr:InlB B-repeat-containing protein [Treponema sp.]
MKPTRKHLWGMLIPILGLGIAVTTGCRQPRSNDVPVVTGVDVTTVGGVSVVGRGHSVTLTATVRGTRLTPEAMAVNWYIVEEDRRPGTGITAAGVLSVDRNEDLLGNQITVRARSAFNTRYFGEITLTIIGQPLMGVRVNFMPNGGTAPVSYVNELPGAIITLDVSGPTTRAGTRAYHVFVGWNTRDDGTGMLFPGNAPFFIPQRDTPLNLYAAWLRYPYDDYGNLMRPTIPPEMPGPGEWGLFNVTLVPNGGFPAIETVLWHVPGGTVLTLPSSGFTRPGYEFIGWSLEPGDEAGLFAGYSPFIVDAEADFVVLANVTLYARWLPAPVPVTRRMILDPNGGFGDPIPLALVPHGIRLVVPEAGFFKTDHAHAGWARTPVATGAPPTYPLGHVLVINEDITLYAVWMPAVITRIRLTPVVYRLSPGESRQFNATVVGTTSSISQDVNWSVSPVVDGVSINQAGVLTIAPNAGVSNGATFTVTATAAMHGSTLASTATVTIFIEPTGLVIRPPDFIPLGGVGMDAMPPLDGRNVSLLANRGDWVTLRVASPEQFDSIRWLFGEDQITNDDPDYGSYVSGDYGETLILGPVLLGGLLGVAEHFLTVEVVFAGNHETHGGQTHSRRISFRVTL